MAIIITNGKHYIYYASTGATKKTDDINLAYQFPTVTDAIKGMKKAKAQTKSYYVFDTITQRILWKWMTQEEQNEVRKNKIDMLLVKRDKNGKIKRKTYSEDTRKLIYLNANGRCELCGKKLLFEDMTIDHVNPLSMGGEDDVNNLACTCFPCNLFKGNILPEDFMNKITDIFMYQMEKKTNHKIMWKVVHRILLNII